MKRIKLITIAIISMFVSVHTVGYETNTYQIEDWQIVADESRVDTRNRLDSRRKEEKERVL